MQPPAPPGLKTQLPAHKQLGDEHFLRRHSPSTHRSWCLGRGWQWGAQSRAPSLQHGVRKVVRSPPACGTALGARPLRPPHRKGPGAISGGAGRRLGAHNRNHWLLPPPPFIPPQRAAPTSFALLTPTSPGTGLRVPQDTLCPTGTVAFPIALSTSCKRELSPSPAIPTVLQEAPASPTEPGCTHGCPRGPAMLSKGRTAGS